MIFLSSLLSLHCWGFYLCNESSCFHIWCIYASHVVLSRAHIISLQCSPQVTILSEVCTPSVVVPVHRFFRNLHSSCAMHILVIVLAKDLCDAHSCLPGICALYSYALCGSHSFHVACTCLDAKQVEIPCIIRNHDSRVVMVNWKSTRIV